MVKTIGFEGKIEGVEKTAFGPQLIVRPVSKTGTIPENMWIIPASDFILRANELFSGTTVRTGDFVMRTKKFLVGKTIIFYIKD